jgi:hypothetical protein
MAQHFRYIVAVLILLLSAPLRSGATAVAVSDSLRGKFYLDAAVNNRTPYVGEEVLLTYTLFFSGMAPKIADTGKQEHAGLWVQEFTPEGYIRSTPAEGKDAGYRKAVVKQMKVVPMQAGRLLISGYRLRCILPLNNRISFENQRDVEYIITGPEVPLEVRPLPDPVPEQFIGAVGRFSVTASPERSRLHVGEPLTLTITISGKGNLKTLPPAAIRMPEGFRQDSPDVSTVLQNRAGNDHEAVSTSVILIPERQGTYRFSPVSLLYFNPAGRSYESASAREITVEVLPAAAAVDRIPEKPPATASENPSDRLPTGMIMLLVTFLLLVLTLYVIGRRQRSRKTPSAVSGEHQALFRSSGNERSPEALRQQLFRALRQNGVQNPESMTGEQLKKALTERNVTDETAGSLLQLLKAIDRLIYSPGTPPAETIEPLYQKAAAIIDAIAEKG